MRRISWIDQRIRDGVAVFLFLPGGGGRFIWHWRIGAMSDGGLNRAGFVGGSNP